MDITRLAKIFRILLIALMIGTVAFIFVNSTLPADESQEQSDAIKDAILEVLPEDSEAYSFVDEYIRKIAHFTEYGLLGIEVAVYIALFERRRLRRAPLALLLPLFVGFIDESIQIISDRGPTISDVWIDIGGFATFFCLALLVICVIYLLVRLVRKHLLSANEDREAVSEE